MADLLFFPTVLLLLQAQLVQITGVAKSVVAANDPTTLGASPLLLFPRQELLDATFLDKLKILYHAHVIAGTIAFV